VTSESTTVQPPDVEHRPVLLDWRCGTGSLSLTHERARSPKDFGLAQPKRWRDNPRAVAMRRY
jgi:hypothetical protein